MTRSERIALLIIMLTALFVGLLMSCGVEASFPLAL